MNEFLDDLFGSQEGIVYAPVKIPNVPKEVSWQQHFFEWPDKRSELEDHLGDFTTRDVYVSPVLFTDKRIAPETFKGTNYLWTEFDGTVPTEVIEPSIRVSSSIEGHEHWYWKLDNFTTDKVLIEDLTRRIAYHYGADLSVWDYQNVLRPVDTWNHKRNKPVTLINKNSNTYSVDDFLWVPIPPAGSKVDIQLAGLPQREAVLAKYKWKMDTLDLLFKRKEDVKDRSTALMRLAFDAIEVGCSNEEAYVLLEERDRVWEKYLGRTDREKQLQNCLAKARGKKLVIAELHQEPTDEVYRFNDFMRTKITLKWAIKGLLPVAGSMVIVGKPGIGKSTFALRMGMALALGEKEFLGWEVVERQRVLFVSLEMQHAELKQFFEDMNIAEEKREELQEWFHIWPIGYAWPFDVPDQQPDMLKFIDRHKINLVILDSLGLSMYGSIKSDDDVKRLNSFLNQDVRSDRNCGYVFIHHDRKPGIDDGTKVAGLDDAFGSRYITANAQTVVILTQKKSSTKLHIHVPKTRMMLRPPEFDVERTPDRGFVVVGSHITPTTETRNLERSSPKEPDVGSLGALFDI